MLKAPPRQAFDQRWTAWGVGFGGNNTDQRRSGDRLEQCHRAATTALPPAWIITSRPTRWSGFALAGGGTNWGLAQGLGGGRSDAFQAGVYGKTYFGPAYVAAALAFTNHWMTTNRIALGDQLTASFNGQSYGARLEGRLSLRVSPARRCRRHALCGVAGAELPHASATARPI